MSPNAGFIPSSAYRTLQILVCLVLCGSAGFVARAQAPQFTITADVREAVAGIPVEVTITLEGAECQRFTPPVFKDFRTSGGASESRGVTITQGRTSVRQSWSYSIEPLHAGTYQIGPATAQVNGKTIISNILSLTVLASSSTAKGLPAPPPGRGDEVFIVGDVDRKTAYPGQQLIWRLILYTRVAIEGADMISMPDFDGFYSKEKRSFDTRTEYQNFRGKKYAVKILHEERIFPQQTGELTVGSAQIRVGLEQSGAQGFLFGPKPVTLATQPVSITVKPFPQPEPPNFTGAAGQFSWEVHADTNALSTDDALTIKVSIRGNGDTRRFSAPKFSVPADCEIFEPRILSENELETEQELAFTKELEYVVLPKAPGDQEITPALSYFNPDSNRYCTLTAAPIRFSVVAGKNYQTKPDTIQAPVETASQTSLLDAFLQYFNPAYLFAAIAAAALGIGIFLLFRRRKARPEPAMATLTTRPMPPAPDARVRFFQATQFLQEKRPELFYGALLKCLQTFISDKLKIPTAQVNHAFVQSRLMERGVTPIRAQAFVSLWLTCEQAVYAGQFDDSRMEADLRSAESLLQEMEREIR